MEQPFIKKGGKIKFSEVKEHVAKLGFEPSTEPRDFEDSEAYANKKSGTVFVNKETGIKISDLHGENVIKGSDGEIYFIDPIIEFTQDRKDNPSKYENIDGGKPFAESFGVKTTELPTGSNALGITLGGTNVSLSDVDANTVKLEGITTPEGKRNQGKAKAALKKITEEADKQNKTITLEVEPEKGVSTEEGLRKLLRALLAEATAVTAIWGEVITP